MNYVEFNVSGKEYKLRLSVRSVVALEKALGKNPIYIFMNKENNNIPTIEEMVMVLAHALKAYHPELTMDDAYDLFDKWIDEEHIMGDFVQVLTELYILSGLFKKQEKN